MANDIQDEEDQIAQDQGSDQVVAPPQAPQIASPIQPPVVSPNAAPVMAPQGRWTPSDQAMRSRAQQDTWLAQQQNAGIPIDQAEAAYAAALRFQGQRAYEEDLQRGMPQAEAFAKNAMHMFASPKTTLAQAGAFMKDITPKPVPVITPYQQAELAQRKTTEARLQAESDARKNRILNPAPKNIGPTVDRIRKVETQLDQLAEDQATELAKNSQITKEQAKKIGPFGPLADSMRSDLIGLRNQVQGMKGIPQAPLDAKSRVVGKTYQTPKGPHVWTGKGWRAVPEPTATPSDQEEGSDAQ